MDQVSRVDAVPGRKVGSGPLRPTGNHGWERVRRPQEDDKISLVPSFPTHPHPDPATLRRPQ